MKNKKHCSNQQKKQFLNMECAIYFPCRKNRFKQLEKAMKNLKIKIYKNETLGKVWGYHVYHGYIRLNKNNFKDYSFI